MVLAKLILSEVQLKEIQNKEIDLTWADIYPVKF